MEVQPSTSTPTGPKFSTYLPKQAPPFDPAKSLLLPLILDLSILHKQKLEVVKFAGINGPNAAQLYYLNNFEHQLKTTGRVRTIILKARQMGFSTMTEALAFLFCFLYERYRVTIVAHDDPASAHILGITSLFWEQSTYAKAGYTTTSDSRSSLAWSGTRSAMSIMTAGSRELGRSRTGFFLHASEVAFWEKAAEKMLALRQGIPNADRTIIILESTANGVGNYFHQTWEEASDPKSNSEYTPLFFAWFQDPTYRASVADPWGTIMARIGPADRLDDEEKALVRAYNVDRDQLAWRRYAIKNLATDGKAFAQEYPASPEEAFVVTGTNVFPEPELAAVYQPMDGTKGRLERDGRKVTFLPDPLGPLTIFKYPHKQCTYIIGCDPTRNEGKMNKRDYACAQVLNRDTFEQVAVFHSRIDSDTLGREIFKLGLYFNTATIAPETQGPGNTTVGVLLGMNYPRIWAHQKWDKTPGKTSADIWGWSTTEQTKPAAISKLLRVVLDGFNEGMNVGLRIHHRLTYSEMKKFIQDGMEYRPADQDFGGHDDTVMALAIAISAHFLEGLPDFITREAMNETANDDLLLPTRNALTPTGSLPIPEWLSQLEDV